MDDSKFSASLFNVTFSPDTPGVGPNGDGGIVDIDINGDTTISGNVIFTLEVIAYGYTVISKEVDPCKVDGFSGMCPMRQGPINLSSSTPIDKASADLIPGTLFPSVLCCPCGMADIFRRSYRIPSSGYRRESEDYGQQNWDA